MQDRPGRACTTTVLSCVTVSLSPSSSWALNVSCTPVQWNRSNWPKARADVLLERRINWNLETGDDVRQMPAD